MDMKIRRTALGAVSALALAACGSGPASTAATTSASKSAAAPAVTRTTTKPLPSSAKVLYLVRGTATSADITLKTPTGTSQQSDVSVPLETKSGKTGLEYSFDYGEFVYVSAQNKGSSGTISCIIQVNGIAISTNQSSGAYAIATCDGST